MKKRLAWYSESAVELQKESDTYECTKVGVATNSLLGCVQGRAAMSYPRLTPAEFLNSMEFKESARWKPQFIIKDIQYGIIDL